MTREEFVATGTAWHGSAIGWQAALARALDVERRTIGRAVKDGPSDKLARALLGLLGDSAPVRVPAEWICGDGNDGREYLVHTLSPRFLCLVLTDSEYDAFDHQSPADFHAGGIWLCGFHWIDRRPDDVVFWMENAADAVDRFS